MKRVLLLTILASIAISLFDCGSENGPSSTNCDIEGFDNDSLQLQLKKHLVDHINFGLCFGMPSPVLPSKKSWYVKSNDSMANIIELAFGISDTAALYDILTKFEEIKLEKSGCKYTFTFRDGSCCQITRYTGEIWVDNDAIFFRCETDSIWSEPC